MSVLVRSLSYRGVSRRELTVWVETDNILLHAPVESCKHLSWFQKLFHKKHMQSIVLSQQSINKSSSVTTQRRPLRKNYKGHRADWIKQVFTKSNLTRVLSMTWTKYETGFPVQETARPWGFSSETCNIVPISRKQIEKI